MTYLAMALGVALGVAGAASAQTLTPSSGGGYDGFTTSALTCLAENHGAQDVQAKCLDMVIEDCRAKAGVYEACLDAVQTALIEARQRVEAMRLTTCTGDLDPACGVLVDGRGLIAAGVGLDAQAWTRALTEED